ncbi:MAG TPA: transcription elongation factor GreA [Steroidobacteraceae bacterium]|jgi:transcription elongation factor GreA|nr:transcription elongation factor GreA [Steroidobacteraceae bacterium]
MTRKPMTSKGADRLRLELKRLKTVERPRIIQSIAEARAHGDLSENAEYHAAREQQGFCEGRIKELEHELSHCQIIDVSHLPKTDKVVFGATVALEAESGEEVVFQIVGEAEADVRLGLISITSPIARALVGKCEGDEVDVAVPGGTRTYEIVSVSYA